MDSQLQRCMKLFSVHRYDDGDMMVAVVLSRLDGASIHWFVNFVYSFSCPVQIYCQEQGHSPTVVPHATSHSY